MSSRFLIGALCAVTTITIWAGWLVAMRVGMASNLYERLLERPAIVPLVPGVLLLVPGSIGFRSLTLLLEQQVVVGIDAAFTMLLTAMSLVAGLLLADIILPPRQDAVDRGTMKSM